MASSRRSEPFWLAVAKGLTFWFPAALGLSFLLKAYGAPAPSWWIFPASVFIGIAWGARRFA